MSRYHFAGRAPDDGAVWAGLLTKVVDLDYTAPKIRAMQTLGVPYPKGYDKIANEDVKKQAEGIQADLAKDGIKIGADREIIAVIAYLQRWEPTSK